MTLNKACKELVEEMEKEKKLIEEIGPMGDFGTLMKHKGYLEALQKYEKWLFGIKTTVTNNKELLNVNK